MSVAWAAGVEEKGRTEGAGVTEEKMGSRDAMEVRAVNVAVLVVRDVRSGMAGRSSSRRSGETMLGCMVECGLKVCREWVTTGVTTGRSKGSRFSISEIASPAPKLVMFLFPFPC